MPSQSLVCSLASGGVSANSPVAKSEFATSPMERLRILEAMTGSPWLASRRTPTGQVISPPCTCSPRGTTSSREPSGEGDPRAAILCLAKRDSRTGEVVDVFRPASEAPPLVEQAIEIGAKVFWMQFGVINYEAAKRAREAGLQVVMDQCMKVEHGRFFGNLAILGFNTGVISARRWDPKAGSKKR